MVNEKKKFFFQAPENIIFFFSLTILLSFFNISFYCGMDCFKSDWRQHKKMHKRRKDHLRRPCSNPGCQKTEPVFGMWEKCEWCDFREIPNPEVYCSRLCQSDDLSSRHGAFHSFITFSHSVYPSFRSNPRLNGGVLRYDPEAVARMREVD